VRSHETQEKELRELSYESCFEAGSWRRSLVSSMM
jgi:hypothetical protein